MSEDFSTFSDMKTESLKYIGPVTEQDLAPLIQLTGRSNRKAIAKWLIGLANAINSGKYKIVNLQEYNVVKKKEK